MADHRRGPPRRRGRGAERGTWSLALTEGLAGSQRRWLVAGVPGDGSTGGASRARHIFASLTERTNARLTPAHGRRGIPGLALAVASATSGWRRPVSLASTQLLPDPALAVVRGPVTPAVLDVHDHPVLQAASLGFGLPSDQRPRLERMVARNMAVFERLVVPSASFVDLCALPADRAVVVTNGTDSGAIQARPAPADPVVGMVSGAAPGRGIEALVEAVRLIRDEVPGTTLLLALVATGPASSAYLDNLRASRREPWLEIRSVPRAGLDAFLGETAVQVIPHPPGAYYDVSTPVKLFDAMAAGRPLVVTPRLETRRIVEAEHAGVVADSDTVTDLADAIRRLLIDETLRRDLGANARRAAVERYDWAVLSERLAAAILADAAAT